MNSIKMAGLLQQQANYSPYGVKTKYLSFSSVGDRVVFGDLRASFQGKNSNTVEFWYKVSTNYNLFPRLLRIGSNATCIEIIRDTSVSNISYRRRLNNVEQGSTRPGPGALDTWAHVAFVYDGTDIITYLNGEFLSPKVASGNNMNITDSTSYFGWDHPTAFANFDMDEFRIWNTARTEAEIKRHMNTRLTGWETGLVAYYSMNLGSGSTLPNDQKDGLNDGTIYGATWVNT
jgi:hypothetical protein